LQHTRSSSRNALARTRARTHARISAVPMLQEGLGVPANYEVAFQLYAINRRPRIAQLYCEVLALATIGRLNVAISVGFAVPVPQPLLNPNLHYSEGVPTELIAVCTVGTARAALWRAKPREGAALPVSSLPSQPWGATGSAHQQFGCSGPVPHSRPPLGLSHSD
jgi:hypothetical protein